LENSLNINADWSGEEEDDQIFYIKSSQIENNVLNGSGGDWR
jgi:hypothetical protein